MTMADNDSTQNWAGAMKGMDKSGRQTTTALGIKIKKPARQQSCEKIKKSSSRKKTFFRQCGLSGLELYTVVLPVVWLRTVSYPYWLAGILVSIFLAGITYELAGTPLL